MSQDIEWLLKEKYGGEKSEAFFADCKRLALGEPLGYLIGWVPFLDTKIYLDSRPLVPRVETEFWTEKAIEEIKSAAPTAPRVLDLCAGSGCIGVAVAKAIPDAHVSFVEIDAKHKATIEKNLLENGIERDRSTVYQTSLFQGVAGTYDFILANPPYIDSDLNRVGEEVTNFEPHLALFGGRGGIEIISQIVAVVANYLNPSGQFWFEHEPEQTRHIHALATAHGFDIRTHLDQYSVERYSVLMLK